MALINLNEPLNKSNNFQKKKYFALSAIILLKRKKLIFIGKIVKKLIMIYLFKNLNILKELMKF